MRVRVLRNATYLVRFGLGNPLGGRVHLRRYQNGNNAWPNALQGLDIMLVFFAVPPSLRQAAGPLIRNLPRVFRGGLSRADSRADRIAVASAGDPVLHRIDAFLERPSPRGTQSRLASRDLAPAPLADTAIVGRIEVGRARLEKQRGHLAQAAKS
jgi:hypothetical protein